MVNLNRKMFATPLRESALFANTLKYADGN